MKSARFASMFALGLGFFVLAALGMTMTDNRRFWQPVWKLTATQMTWAADASSAASETAYNVSCMVRGAVVVASDATNAITYTLVLKDENGAALFTQAAIPENANTTISGIDVAICGTLVVEVTPSGVPGAGGSTVDVDLYGE